MLAKVLAPAHIGIEGQVIDIECDISNGLPAFIVVGLGDEAIKEARDRVRSALKNSNLVMPPKRVTLNLAPADLPKDGTAFDLGIAIAVLSASKQVEVDLSNKLFAGELALDGSLRPVRGVLSYAKLALEQGLSELFVPTANAPEAALASGLTIYPVQHLRDLYRHLVGEKPLSSYRPKRDHIGARRSYSVDLADVYGQDEAKRALEIAAAGGHNILLSGPPGSGKTLLAKALMGILPPPSLEEMMEITQIHSLAGQNQNAVIKQRPFRNPHHTASDVALIGGGRWPRPGEISLSHRGVLFLDELPEFPRSVLEVLRQPLEDGTVTVSRASGSITYPAKFMLIATQNPCPCGYAGDSIKECSCSPSQVTKYSRKISGPLLDRIDLVVNVNRVNPDRLTNIIKSETSEQVSGRIDEARLIQRQRYQEHNCQTNAEMQNTDIETYCELAPDAGNLAKQALSHLSLSARSYMRLLKVARTIADLDRSESVEARHLSEALQYRPKA